ncbi:MAG: DUF885 domain-containing protein [Acidimicrobiales bacterium]
MDSTAEPYAHDLVDRYLRLGLRLGRHLDGLVDAYYGPEPHKQLVDNEPLIDPAVLGLEARSLLGELEPSAGSDLAPERRHWLAAQVRGLAVTATKLAGGIIEYANEVEACYGVRPRWIDEEELVSAHRRLDEALPGSGHIGERLTNWRETQAVPVERLGGVLHSLSDDLRERTDRIFGLPEGEYVDIELVTDKPWSGFNYYLGDLHSRVAINVDLPVLAPGLAHLMAHEAYPGHHTEHTRKEVGLVRQRHFMEETIFIVGTPQCLMAEGLADLGLEVLISTEPEAQMAMLAEHLKSQSVVFDQDTAVAVAQAGVGLGRVRGNVALLLHARDGDEEEAIAYAQQWGLLARNRAEKLVGFLTDPVWRAYMTCYVEGFPLCQQFVAGDPTRFARLLNEQLTPSDLVI